MISFCRYYTALFSDFDHFKVLLARSAFRTSPVYRYIQPAGTWRDALFRQAGSLVINKTTGKAHPGLIGLVACSVRGRHRFSVRIGEEMFGF